MLWCALFFLSLTPSALAEDVHAARIEAASAAYAAAQTELSTGMGAPEAVYRWSCRWLDSTTSADTAGVRAALAAHQARMVDLQETVTTQVQQGTAPASGLAAARYYVAEAAVWVERGLPVE
ncbi:MAG: hypothetical protein ACI8RZ_004583 [Myxococcota bacterium]|jgi:hypothetical protein